MEKKVLILEGSPHKHGNTAQLCDSFERGAKEAGNFVKRIFIRDLDIHGCLGCNAC